MSGLNFVYMFNGGIEEQQAKYQKALNKTLFEESHHVQTFFDETGYVLSSTQYEGYPIRTFQKDGLNICVEGKVYSLDQEQFMAELIPHAKRLLAEETNAKNDYSKWLSDIDGEFIVLVVDDSSDKVLILNDIFSNLPVYIHRTDSRVVVSRNYRFVANMISDKEIDRLATAQYLIFRYILGDRTYLKDVYRLKPAEVVLIDKSSRKVSREIVYTFNFEQKEHSNRSVKRNAKELVPLFIEACRTRIDPNHKIIVSQSGGMDSRAVAAGISRCGVKFKSMATLDVSGFAITDVKIAQGIADSLSVEFEMLKLDSDNPKNIIRVLKMKSGFAYIGKVQQMQFFDRIVKEYGHNVTLFTGVGGDKVGHDLSQCVARDDLEFLANQVIDCQKKMNIELAASLAGITKEEILEEICKEFQSYPEQSGDQKIVHFFLYGRAYKWQLEGNDRRRHLFWTTYPMFSTKFFRYFMNCPDKQKRNLRLYAIFLKYLEPKIADLPLARNGYIEPISLAKNRSLAWYLFLVMLKCPNPLRFVFKKIKKLVKKTFVKESPDIPKTFSHSPDLLECIRKQVTETTGANDYIDIAQVQTFLDNADKYSHEALANLFTLTSAIESFMTDNCTIEQYLDADLGSFKPRLSKHVPLQIL